MDMFHPENDSDAPIYFWADEVEAGAYYQATNLAKLPFIFQHVALMPDVHEGYGMPIGGVIACHNAVIPNAVGVDIGCGMVAVQTNRSVYDFPQEELPEVLKKIHHSIKRDVPVGFNTHRDKQEWKPFEDYIETATDDAPRWMTEKNWERAMKSLGTLGGGNHFVEIQKSCDQNGTIWIMLHSGSRNLGKVIADYYHKEALEMCLKWHSKLPHKDLAFLPVDSKLGQEYLRDMNFALKFAHENRRRMMERCQHHVKHYFGPDTEFLLGVNIHHNYANLENHMGHNVWVHRKGATSAREGELGIIPGSMGTASYIVIGRGNPMSFMSCSHGAGRKMGRMDACRTLKEEDCNKAMGEVVFDGWGKVKRGKMDGAVDLGEAPGAYKDIDTVIENQRDLVKIHTRLLPLAVVKG